MESLRLTRVPLCKAKCVINKRFISDTWKSQMWLRCLENDLGALPEKCVIKQHSYDIIKKGSPSAAAAVLRYKWIICLEAESTKAAEQ